MKEKKLKKNNIIWVVVMTLLLVVMTAAIGIFAFQFYMGGIYEVADETEYDKYYVMITEDRKASFWQSVYQGAYEEGLEQNEIDSVKRKADALAKGAEVSIESTSITTNSYIVALIEDTERKRAG